MVSHLPLTLIANVNAHCRCLLPMIKIISRNNDKKNGNSPTFSTFRFLGLYFVMCKIVDFVMLQDDVKNYQDI